MVVGVRDDDDHLDELQRIGIRTWTVSHLRLRGSAGITSSLGRDDLEGFWVHVDVDVLDPEIMPAVDTPTPGGLDDGELVAVLSALLELPRCVGLEVIVFDPDLDPDGGLASQLTETLVAAFDATGRRP